VTEAVRETYGDFTSIVGEKPAWVVGGFALPDGSFWEYREPDAVAVVQNGRLRVAARQVTRKHDTIQILDNAKHMFFSSRSFEVPPEGGVSFECEIRSMCKDTAPGDLYDGFVSLNLLDFSEGGALDWFVGHDRIAPVYARLPFPGVVAGDAKPLKYFAIFEELAHTPGDRRRVRIAYDRALDEAGWWLDGEEVWRYTLPVKLNVFTMALGIMTEKDLTAEGSVSCHGQGIIGEWSPIEVTTWPTGSSRPAELFG
jgi:uncharacterized protein DUF6081